MEKQLSKALSSLQSFPNQENWVTLFQRIRFPGSWRWNDSHVFYLFDNVAWFFVTWLL